MGPDTTTGFMLACLVAWLTLAAVCSSEMLVNLYQTAWHHIPEDGMFHSHCCENLIPHIYPCSKPKVVLYIKWLHYFTILLFYIQFLPKCFTTIYSKDMNISSI
jgi:hypothetical protein